MDPVGEFAMPLSRDPQPREPRCPRLLLGYALEPGRQPARVHRRARDRVSRVRLGQADVPATPRPERPHPRENVPSTPARRRYARFPSSSRARLIVAVLRTSWTAAVVVTTCEIG